MDAPHWTAAPGERPTDIERRRRVISDRSICRDCGATQTENWYHFPAGPYCESCFHVREDRGEVNDPRTRAELHAAQQRKSA